MSNSFTSLSNFTPKGDFGTLFTQAKIINHLNKQLSKHLPDTFKTLSLCTINHNTATFITSNQALAFRAQQQHGVLLATLNQLESTIKIEKIIIKVDLNY